jgi:glycosyltransferase involved in cell wall biosynthesis
MKRVLLSAYSCFPNRGSEPGYGWNWAIHLAERGMDVRVLTRFMSQEQVDQIEAYCGSHPDLSLRFSFFNVELGLRNAGLNYAMWQWRAVREAEKLLKTETYDIIHHVTFGTVMIPTQLWRLNIPVVFGPIGGGQTAPRSMMEYFGKAQWKERWRTLMTRALPFSPLHRRWISKMSAVLATNRDTSELLRLLGRPDAQPLHDTALPESFFALEPRTFEALAEPLRLLWVGRLLPRKAIPLALDILAKVEVPCTLTIIGDGLEEGVVREMIRARGLEDRVFWKPERLPWTEVRDAYGKHDAFLFTSLRDSVGVQLLEAMALGLPVITLGIHGGGELVQDEAGFKIPVHSKEQVVRDAAAAVTQYAAMSPEARSQMSAAGWSFARTMTWPRRAAIAEEIYDRILQGPNARVPDGTSPDANLPVRLFT